MINRIQNKFFFYIMCANFVYVLCVYKYVHMHVEWYEKICCLYIKYIYIIRNI